MPSGLRKSPPKYQFAPETIVREKLSDGYLALTAPWEGPTGTATLTFQHDQRNYAVAFRMPVP